MDLTLRSIGCVSLVRHVQKKIVTVSKLCIELANSY